MTHSAHTHTRYWPELAIIGGMLLLALVAWIDVLTGTEFAFSVFYFLPVALVSWYAPWRTIRVVFCITASVVWLLADRIGGHVYSFEPIAYWNLAAELGSFLLISLLLSTLHRVLADERAVARTDALTKVPNRRWFLEIVEQELIRTRRYHHAVSLAFIDIDNFKEINDRYGHRRGDEFLSHIAAVMRRALRSPDFIGRMGGDEFAVLLPETGAEASRVVMEKLQRELRQLFAKEEGGELLSVSIGLVTCPVEPPAVWTELIEQADGLMYAAKRAGKDKVKQEVFDPSLDPENAY